MNLQVSRLRTKRHMANARAKEYADNLYLKRKKAEKESFAETVLLLRKLLVGELKTNSKRGASVEGQS